jgi:hypothetical protein
MMLLATPLYIKCPGFNPIHCHHHYHEWSYSLLQALTVSMTPLHWSPSNDFSSCFYFGDFVSLVHYSQATFLREMVVATPPWRMLASCKSLFHSFKTNVADISVFLPSFILLVVWGSFCSRYNSRSCLIRLVPFSLTGPHICCRIFLSNNNILVSTDLVRIQFSLTYIRIYQCFIYS